MKYRKPAYFTALAASAALTLAAAAACSAPQETDPTSLPSVPSPTETVVTTPPAPPADQSIPLGQTATTEKGLDVTVTPAGTGVDSYTSKPYTDYTISVTNNTGANFDPVLISTSVNYGAAGTPATAMFDLIRIPQPYFKGVILPGGTQTVTQTYDVPAGEPVVISVTPSWDDSPVTFTG